MPRTANLQRAGWIIAIIGVTGLAAASPLSAWLTRHSDTSFNFSVGWANVLSTVLTAAGLIMSISDKILSRSTQGAENLVNITDDLARQELRQDSLLLSQLLGTDSLDNRPTRGTFQVGTRHGQAKERGKRQNSEVREFEDIVDFYLKETRGRLLILGSPGAGKTALAVFLTVGLLQRRAGEQSGNSNNFKTVKVPCLLNLPSWDPNSDTLIEWAASQIADRFRIAKKTAISLLKDGWILPVLDGLDEMDMQREKTPSRTANTVSRINDYIASTPDCEIAIVSRSGSNYSRLSRGIKGVQEITVQNLNARQVIGYLEEQFPGEGELDAWKPVFAQLSDIRSPVIKALDTNWRVSAAATFCLLGADPAALLPTEDERKNPGREDDYLHRVSELLIDSFITSRILNSGIPRSRLPIVKAHLHALGAAITRFEESSAPGSEIILHHWWKRFGQRGMMRRHQVFAWLLTQSPWILFGIFALIFPLPKSDDNWTTVLALSVNSITIALFTTLRSATRKGPLAIQLDDLHTRAKATTVTTALVLAAGIGAPEAIFSGILYGTCYAIIAAAFFIIRIAISGTDNVQASHPATALRNDRNFSVLLGSIIGAYVFLYYLPLYGTAAGFTFGIMGLSGTMLSSSWMRYLITVEYGWRIGLPIRFHRFLHWSHEAGILRISGIGYQFRHQEILDYLANPRLPQEG